MLRADRLGQEIVAARVQRFEMLVGIVLAGEEHDRRRDERLALADQRGQLHAVDVGHVQIHQDQLGPEAIELVERGQPFGDRERLHAGLAQDRFGEERLRAIVLDDHDAKRMRALGVDQLADARDHVGGRRRQRE